MAAKNEVSAQIMEHLCAHDWHGYSQPGRWGDGEGYCDVVVDGQTYRVAQGDRDCATSELSALKAAGIYIGGASWTGDMRDCLVATGNYEWMPMSYIAQRGDLYLNEYGNGMPDGCNGHTAMCTSSDPDMMAEFSISETGGIDGETGDQTGWESSIHEFRDCPFDGILRYTGKADGNTTTQASTNDESEITMQCIFSPGDRAAMYYFDGAAIHYLSHPDQVIALNRVYNKCHGRDIPCFEWGTVAEYPIFGRLNEAVTATVDGGGEWGKWDIA